MLSNKKKYIFTVLLISITILSIVLFITPTHTSSNDRNTFVTDTSIFYTPNDELVHVDFTDITLQTGIDFSHIQGDSTLTGLNEVMGSGVCAFDFNNDGWQDIFIVGGPGQTRYFGKSHWWQEAQGSKLFKNLGDGKFKDVTKAAGLKHQYWGMGCTSGDLDNDGDQELFVTTFDENYLYKNNGDGSFSDISKASGIRGNSWSTSVTLSDYDKDGLLDIYVVNYLLFNKNLRTIEKQSGFSVSLNQFFDASNFDSAENTLYKNTGNLTFTDVTKFAGVENSSGRGLAATWTDINNDNFPDLIIANDKNSVDLLYLNKKNGTFSQVSEKFPIGKLTTSSSIAIADFNNNLHNDILTSSSTGDLPQMLFYQTPNNKNSLLPLYREHAYTAFTPAQPLFSMESWAIGAKDFNNDGYVDIFFANGHRTPDSDSARISTGQKNSLWLNNTGEFFLENNNTLFKDRLSSRGSVFSDFDRDGDIDIFVTNNNDMARFYRNDSANIGNSISIQLQTSHGNRDAIGAKIWLSTDKKNQYQELTSGGVYLSHSSNTMHFGIGKQQKINNIKILWPNNKFTSISLADINTYYLIDQDKGVIKKSLYKNSSKKHLKLTFGRDNYKNRILYLSILAQHDPDLFYTEANKTLQDENKEVRKSTLLQLSKMKTSDSLKLLLSFLDDPSPMLVIDAIKAIAPYEDEQSIHWLLPLFAHKNENVKITLTKIFEQFFIKEEAIVHRKFLAVPYLIRLLKQKSIPVIQSAAVALGESEDFRAVAPLIRLLSHNNTQIQIAASRSLGKIRHQDAINSLLKIVNNTKRDGEVRASALIALKRLNYNKTNNLISSFFNNQLSYDIVLSNTAIIYYILINERDGVVFNRKNLLSTTQKWIDKNHQIMAKKTSQKNVRDYFFLINILTIHNSQKSRRILSSFLKHTSHGLNIYTYNAIIEFGTANMQKTIINALNDDSTEVKKIILDELKNSPLNIRLSKELITKLYKNKNLSQKILALLISQPSKIGDDFIFSILNKGSQDNMLLRYILKRLLSEHNKNQSIPNKLLESTDTEIQALAIQCWSNKNRKVIKKWDQEFIKGLLTNNKYALFLMTTENRTHIWINQMLSQLSLSHTAPVHMRKKAIEQLAQKNRNVSFQIFSQLIQNLEPSLLQDALQINSTKNKKLLPLLQNIFNNSKIDAHTKLITAEKIINLSPKPSLNILFEH